MTTAATPTSRGAIQSLIDRRMRAVQTSFVASVVSYDRNTQTATVRPQHLEVFGPTENTQGLPDLDNTPVSFPGASGYSITWDLSPGDFVLVTCTKYSLDVWRQRAEVSDPGDSRKFGLSGAIAHAIRVNEDGGETAEVKADGMVIAAPKIYLTSKDAADAMALASKCQDGLVALQSAFDAHVHATAALGAPSVPTPVPMSIPVTTNPSWPASGDVASTKIKGE